SAVGSRRSTLVRITPGMEATGSTMFVPSQTNTGRIRSSAASRDWRTRRRVKSSRRPRRMRRAGKRPREKVIAECGNRAGTFSMGPRSHPMKGYSFPASPPCAGALIPIKAFLPRLYSPLAGALFFALGNEHGEPLRGLVHPLGAQAREELHRGAGMLLRELGAHPVERHARRLLGELVRLREEHVGRPVRRVQPFDEAPIERPQ